MLNSRVEICVTLIACLTVGLSSAGSENEHVHIKVHLPEVINKHTHVRTVFRHIFHPKKQHTTKMADIHGEHTFIHPAAVLSSSGGGGGGHNSYGGHYYKPKGRKLFGRPKHKNPHRHPFDESSHYKVYKAFTELNAFPSGHGNDGGGDDDDDNDGTDNEDDIMVMDSTNFNANANPTFVRLRQDPRATVGQQNAATGQHWALLTSAHQATEAPLAWPSLAPSGGERYSTLPEFAAEIKTYSKRSNADSATFRGTSSQRLQRQFPTGNGLSGLH